MPNPLSCVVSVCSVMVVTGRGQCHVSHLKLLQLGGDQSLRRGQRSVTLLDALMNLGHGVRGAVTTVCAALEHPTLQQQRQRDLMYRDWQDRQRNKSSACYIPHVHRWDTYLHFTDVVLFQALDHVFDHILHSYLVCLCHLCSLTHTNYKEIFSPTI